MKERLIKKFEDEIHALNHELKLELPKEIKRARELGDLRENAEYQAAKERQRLVESRISMLQKRVAEIALINVDRIPKDRAGFGSTLHEAGVKIDVVGGRGVGVVGALFAAVDGAQRLWDEKGFWRAPDVQSLYGWRAVPRAVAWALAASVAIVAVPTAAVAVGLVVFPIDFLLKMVGAGGASGLVGAYLRFAEAAFGPDALPTWPPRPRWLLLRRATSDAADARRAEVFDLAGVARDHLPDAVAAALTVPLATAWHTVTFAPDAYWRGETHRLGDRPASLIRLIDELIDLGVEQIVLVSAAPESPGPHALAAPRLDGRGRLGEYLLSTEAAIVRDATTTTGGVRIFTVRPVHNPIGPFDFTGGYDDRSQRAQGLAALMNRGYERACPQFIEP